MWEAKVYLNNTTQDEFQRKRATSYISLLYTALLCLKTILKLKTFSLTKFFDNFSIKLKSRFFLSEIKFFKAIGDPQKVQGTILAETKEERHGSKTLLNFYSLFVVSIIFFHFSYWDRL